MKKPPGYLFFEKQISPRGVFFYDTRHAPRVCLKKISFLLDLILRYVKNAN